MKKTKKENLLRKLKNDRDVLIVDLEVKYDCAEDVITISSGFKNFYNLCNYIEKNLDDDLKGTGYVIKKIKYWRMN